jgi:adenosylhomocysteinase
LPFEIDTPELLSQSVEVEEFEDGIESCTLSSGKRIVLLCGGRMFNLGGKEPKGNTLECMDMGFTLQALSHECVVNAADELVAGPQPVPARINNDTAMRMLSTMS